MLIFLARITLYHGNKKAVTCKKECSKEYSKSYELEVKNYLIFKNFNFNHVLIWISKFFFIILI